jgi:two-component system NtrC family sensor kinase
MVTKAKVLTVWSMIWLLATVLFVAGGALNLLQRAKKDFPPTDGVVWVQKDGGVYAEKVISNLSGARAGIVAGDKLIAISLDENNYDQITSASDVQMYLETAGINGSLTYLYQRPSYSFKNNFYYADLRRIDSVPRWTASTVLLTFVGTIWLLIGMFVLFKQGGNAPFVLHFATLCLVAFIFHVYKSIGAGEDFDLAVTILDDCAFAFFAPIFLHFCWRYPTRSAIFSKYYWKTFLIYIPAVLIFSATVLCYIISGSESLNSIGQFIGRFDILGNLYFLSNVNFFVGIFSGAGILIWRFFSNKQAIVRQRLKWTIWGTVAAVVPALSFQAAKRFIDLPDDSISAALTTLPLALIPISFGHSVVRYRLMDVDIVVRRVLVYLITTVAIAMLVAFVALGLISFAVGNDFPTVEVVLTPEYALRGLIATIAMAAIILFQNP